MKSKYQLAYGTILTTVVCAVVIFAGFVWSFFRIQKVDFHFQDNRIRSFLMDTIHQLESGETAEAPYPYMVFNLDGQVQYADEVFEQKAGEQVNVQEMIQTDQYFKRTNKGSCKEVFVLKRNQTITGFAVFLIPEEQRLVAPMWKQIVKSVLPFLCAAAFLLVVQIVETVFYHYGVFCPIRKISRSANHIVRGNYDYEVLRVNGTHVRENEMGDLVYSFELMRDELKSKQMREEELKKSQQELISCISHDLKTPISTIKAYGEGLRDGIASTEELRREYEEVIIRKTDLLNEMISELLEYSNAQLNQLEIIPEEIYFKDYFEHVGKELQFYAKQRETELKFQSDISDMLVTIDSKRITEVLYNLVENSIKYMGEKPGKIWIFAERQEQGVLIRVLDNGTGINADDIPYVFDKFYRGEKSRTSSIPGSGLGLSICKHIIESQGGTIYCKNGSSEGCEIGFTLRSDL